MACVTSPIYSFLINGAISGRVYPKCGIRQGYPLSPYLFILCAKGFFFIMLSAVEVSWHINGVQFAYNAMVTHLLFTDDSFIFYWTALCDCTYLKYIFDFYITTSGQCFNYDNFSLLFSPNVSLSAHGNHSSVLLFYGINVW